MGRGIGPQDSATAPAVAVVNETFVKGFFPPGSNPIGRRFRSPGPDSSGDFEIVGVVEDTTYISARWKDHRMYFLSMMQRPRQQQNADRGRYVSIRRGNGSGDTVADE